MSIVAFDLGAGSGRALLGRLDNSKMRVEEIHRFPNDPVRVGNRLHWDILRLYHEIKHGLGAARQKEPKLHSIGIDSWAVDFGLIGRDGELLGNPYHYRDSHTDGVMKKVLQRIPASEVFARTGVQFLPFNTIYQLAAIREKQPDLLFCADQLLMIPDLLRYFLTGERYGEFTNATTTQLFTPVSGGWDQHLISSLNIPGHIFPDVLQPGSPAGTLRPSVQAELGVLDIPVLTVAEHDTGSAVAAVPALDHHFAYLSCGTWSLMGTEVKEPVLSERARELNFTNEGGVNQTYRLLKNIMGLWILQECKREWARQGRRYEWPELMCLAMEAPSFQTLIDPDHDMFLPPDGMPERIRQYAFGTSQPVPGTPGEMVRCILESLSLKYRMVLEMTEELSGRTFSGLHMVGGGTHNELLCQWTANAIRRPVWAGPAEGSAIGNLVVQWIAAGEIADIREARKLIRSTFGVKEYEPDRSGKWEEAYGKFRRIARSDETIKEQ